MSVKTQISIPLVKSLLEAVCDPEIPCLTIEDLGVLREVWLRDETLVIVITPTYSGCPAMNTIEEDIRAVLHANAVEITQLKHN
jgi:ring-1,2-phenylacetyl-CoA epoxidase subunit PaaD